MENKNENYHVKYPKYRDYSIYIFLVVAGLAFAAGQLIFSAASGIFGSFTWAFGLIAVVVSYLFSIIFYEIFKRLAGKIAGYRLVYTNILGFKYYKDQNDKTHFKFTVFENYGGKTLMAPVDENKAKPVFYHIGGAIFLIVLEGLIVIPCAIVSAKTYNSIPLLSSLILLTMGALTAVLNLAPIYSDSLMDGISLRFLSNKEIRPLYFNNLYNEEALLTAKHDLKLIDVDDYENLLATENAEYQYFYYIHNNNLKNAEKAINKIIDNQKYAFPDVVNFGYANLYFFKLLKEKPEQAEEEYYKEKREHQKACVSSSDFGTLKTTLLITSYIEVSYDYYEHLINKADRMKDHYDYVYAREDEDRLVTKSIEDIKVKKSEWFKPYEPYMGEEENIDNK